MEKKKKWIIGAKNNVMAKWYVNSLHFLSPSIFKMHLCSVLPRRVLESKKMDYKKENYVKISTPV